MQLRSELQLPACLVLSDFEKYKVRQKSTGSVLLLYSTIAAVKRQKNQISRQMGGLPQSQNHGTLSQYKIGLSWFFWLVFFLCVCKTYMVVEKIVVCHHYMSTLPMAELSSRMITSVQQKLQWKDQSIFCSQKRGLTFASDLISTSGQLVLSGEQ